MNEVERFFDSETKAIAVNSNAIARKLAYQLQADTQRKIKQAFGNVSAAFMRGVKVYQFENAAIVRLSPLLSSFAEPQKIQGNPNLWIRLPDAEKLGLGRMGKAFSWTDLKRRFGSQLSFVKVNDGTVVLLRTRQGQIKPIYKIQTAVDREQKIEFLESGDRIARENNLEVLDE